MTPGFKGLLKEYRKRIGLSQRQLAEKAGLATATVSKLEQGKAQNPTLYTLNALAEALVLSDEETVEFLAAAGFGLAGGARTSPSDEPKSAHDRRLDRAADQLAYELKGRLKDEAEHQDESNPRPLPVSWRGADSALADSWENIRKAGEGESEDPLDLSGSLDRLPEVYARIRSGRMAVLGRSGSGKTVLTQHLVRELLKSRGPDGRVPVVFRLESWHPGTTLTAWLATQLASDHPSMRRLMPDRSTTAAALLATDRILPILDGLDEMAEVLRRMALKKLNRFEGPLVITSRRDEYRQAVAEAGGPLSGCAVVELNDLTYGDLAGYLQPSRWEPILDAVRSEPAGPLAKTLTTPLMVALARTAYSDGDTDPAELLDRKKFLTGEAVEQHLLKAFVPTVYIDQPEDAQYEPTRARHWLGYLAHHLETIGTRDLAWWQIGASPRPWVRMLIMTITVGLLFALVDIGLAPHLGVYALPTGIALAIGLAIDFSIGAAFGIAHVLLSRFLGSAFEPSRMRLRLRGRMAGTWRTVAHRFGLGFTVGFLIAFGFSVFADLLFGHVHGLGALEVLAVIAMDTSVFGLAAGLGGGLVFAAIALLERPLDSSSVRSPGDLLRASRRTILLQALVFGFAIAVLLPFLNWSIIMLLRQLQLAFVNLNWDQPTGMVFGLYAWIFGAIGYVLALTGWGRWLVFGRLWLPLTGRLPWTLPAFLEDAYDRGVLRRSGVVYQFRHDSLKEHLAAEYREGI